MKWTTLKPLWTRLIRSCWAASPKKIVTTGELQAFVSTIATETVTLAQLRTHNVLQGETQAITTQRIQDVEQLATSITQVTRAALGRVRELQGESEVLLAMLQQLNGLAHRLHELHRGLVGEGTVKSQPTVASLPFLEHGSFLSTDRASFRSGGRTVH